MVEAGSFKATMRHVPTGVTVVTTHKDGALRGITVSAFASVSAEPPLLLICINRCGRSYPLISTSRRFCANVLSRDQRHLAERFSANVLHDQFRGVVFGKAITGAPVLRGAIAYFDCELAGEHRAGTHSIIVGRVLSCGAQGGAPLAYVNGEFCEVISTTSTPLASTRSHRRRPFEALGPRTPGDDGRR